jgi:outer membrane murein-binding lipoprotein Lpp
MTAITLNLLAEEQIAQEAEARDPVKIFIAGAVALVAIVAGLGAYLTMAASSVSTEVASLQSEYDKLTNKLDSEETRLQQAVKALAEDALKANQTRQLMAPELAQVKDVIPPVIQISSLSLNSILEAQVVPVTATDGDPGVVGKKRRAAAPPPVEKLTLRFDGKATSARPEIEVDAFIQSLQTHAVMGEKLKSVTLRSIGRSDKGGDGTLPVAQFVIECQYKESKR